MNKKIILIILSLVIVGYLGFKYVFDGINKPCSPPERPLGLPINAKWIGGCDGGNWIEQISSKSGKYRFKIYQDWDGVLIMDADFILEGCDELVLDTDNLLNLISYYNLEDSLSVLVIESIPGCKLKSVYPAYGGEDWEVIMEK